MVWWEWEREWGRVQHEARGDREGLPSHRRTGGRIKASQAPSGLPATSDPVDRRSEAPPPPPRPHTHTRTDRHVNAHAHTRAVLQPLAHAGLAAVWAASHKGQPLLWICAVRGAPRGNLRWWSRVLDPPPPPAPPDQAIPFHKGGEGVSPGDNFVPPPPPANAAPFGPFLAASAPPLAICL